MYLKEYLKIIQQNFATQIGEEELFRLLFDSIILPLNLTNSNGEPLDYSKSYISSILNRNRPIPSVLRENYYNPKVIDGLTEYFEQNIVKELIPAREEICYQLMSLVTNDSSISPIGKSNLQMIAHPATLSVFLAQLLGYTLSPNTFEPSAKKGTDNSTLRILSIDESERLSSLLCLKDFSPKFISLKKYLMTIDTLINEINTMPYDPRKKVIEFKSISSVALHIDTSNPITISDENIKKIMEFASIQKVKLSNDFFELGDVYTSHAPALFAHSIKGGEKSKMKYYRIQELLQTINQLEKWYPIEQFFSQYQFVDLVLENIGDSPQQNVSVTLDFPMDSLCTADILYDANPTVLRTLMDEFSVPESLGIPETSDYLCYDDADLSSKLQYSSPIFLQQEYPSRAEILSDFNDEYIYKIYKKDNLVQLKIDFPEIMQNTSIAFPTSIILKEKIESISYTLHSRNSPNIISGRIKVR